MIVRRWQSALFLALGLASLGLSPSLAPAPPPGTRPWRLPQLPPAEPASTASPFLVKPYVQLGDAPALGTRGISRCCGTTDDSDADWRWKLSRRARSGWAKRGVASGVRRSRPARSRRTASIARSLTGLATREPSSTTACSTKGAAGLHRARAGAASRPTSPPLRGLRRLRRGHPGAEGDRLPGYLARPDFVMITGDIVYSRGRISEYREKYWPDLQRRRGLADAGRTAAPLDPLPRRARQPRHRLARPGEVPRRPRVLLLLVPAPERAGRHGGRPDSSPAASVPKRTRRRSSTRPGRPIPGMANFSFDYGNAHWTVLDCQRLRRLDRPEPPRVGRERPGRRQGRRPGGSSSFHQPGLQLVQGPLQRAAHAAPGAACSRRARVDMVFAGHVHNYQRSYPLRFVPEAAADGQVARSSGHVDGKWTLDKRFNGRAETQPGRRASISSPAPAAPACTTPSSRHDPASWQEFTHEVHFQHPLLHRGGTNGRDLAVRQISADGAELDRFTVTK